jgi:peptidoglycan hydrolase-like protein with peptidoglycan-binding domain
MQGSVEVAPEVEAPKARTARRSPSAAPPGDMKTVTGTAAQDDEAIVDKRVAVACPARRDTLGGFLARAVQCRDQAIIARDVATPPAPAGPCKEEEPRPHPALLKQGSQHPAVREAQRKLNLATTGSIDAPLVPDCIFGPLTDAAVREFQTAQFGDPKEVDGKIGPKTWAKLDAGAAPGPTPPVPPPTPTPITITSATVKAAPSGAANTRKRVGVGEVVDFTASTAGTWAASNGTPTSGASSTTFRWTAPAVADTVTITLTSGTQTATDTITVDAPKTISMRKVSSHTSLVGAGGACMLTEVTFGPTDVCLGAMQWLEVPGPAMGVDGFFKKFSAATLHHNPNTNFALVNDRNIMEPGPNNGPNDHCAWHSTPGPYKDGTFTWVVPNRYIVDGEPASSGRFFTDTHQVFTMNAAGTMTITKAGATT